MNTLAQSATNKKMLKQPSFRLAMTGLKFAENRGAHKGISPPLLHHSVAPFPSLARKVLSSKS